MIKKSFFILISGMLYLISLFPFWLIYLIADGIYFLLYYVTRYRRKVVDENLLNAFPEKPVEERRIIRKQYFHYLADLLAESIKLLTISEQEVVKRVHVTNPELITDAFKNGQSVLGILGHYGNWELGALRFSQLFNEPRIIVYKPLSNKFFDNFSIKMRSRFGATLVDMKGITRKLLQYRNQRTVTVIVGDQTPAKSEIKYFTDFLNQQTAVFLGVEKLAKFTNSMVVFCDVRRVKRGYYQCSFVPMFTEPKTTADYEITNSHVQYLEKVIQNEPQYWLWSHRRWKFKPEDFNAYSHYPVS